MQKRFLLTVLALWVLLLISCFILGSKQVFAVPPPDCQQCGCKEMWAYRTKDSNGWRTTYSQGYKKDTGGGTWAKVQWGWASNADVGIYTRSDTCPDFNAEGLEGTDTYKMFRYQDVNPVCNGTPTGTDFWRIEDSPSDIEAGSAVGDPVTGRTNCVKN